MLVLGIFQLLKAHDYVLVLGPYGLLLRERELFHRGLLWLLAGDCGSHCARVKYSLCTVIEHQWVDVATHRELGLINDPW